GYRRAPPPGRSHNDLRPCAGRVRDMRRHRRWRWIMSTIAPNVSPEMDALKTRLKATWEAGDYGVFAKYLEPGALEFFDRLNLTPGTRLLDVGCGAGQLTIPAAR